jgi:hypothetical protein
MYVYLVQKLRIQKLIFQIHTRVRMFQFYAFSIKCFLSLVKKKEKNLFNSYTYGTETEYTTHTHTHTYTYGFILLVIT